MGSFGDEEESDNSKNNVNDGMKAKSILKKHRLIVAKHNHKNIFNTIEILLPPKSPII
jgi:hypothetical protein